MSRKLILITLTVIMLFSLNSNVFALTTLHETQKEERISSGVVLKNYYQLTDKGWLDINVLEVDLTNKYTSIGVLNSQNGLRTFETVLDMAKNNESIAAINGDFFGGTSINGYTVGLSIKDGKLLTSAHTGNESKDEFASFILDEDNHAFVDYFSNTITVTSNDTDESITIKEFNRHSDDYDNRPAIYTSDWGEKSIGLPSLTEFVIENNKVTKIKYNKTQDGVVIPKDGFVISATGTAAELLKKNLKVGTKIELDINLKLDIKKINTAISGGTILVKNGEIPTFSSNISGSHPRTAIGISKDEETLYLVTVDGRQKNSIGMTQTELANFLIEKKICNAINLDGGGSTTMVAQKLGDNFLSIINSPSSGTLRKVTNALGIFNATKKSSLSNLLLTTSEENVFVNCERELIVKGYDKYYNPVEVDIDDIKWSIDGVDAKIKDGILIAGNDAGSVKVTAKKGKIKATINIDVLSAPNEISLEPKASYISKNESVKFKTTVKNKNGYYASIKNNELKWEVISGDGKFEDGNFYPRNESTNIICVSAGNAKSYALVEVAATTDEEINYIKDNNYGFVSYPFEVTGNAISCLADNKEFIKLNYDFSKTTATRAAYLRFKEPIELNEKAIELSFNIISSETISDYIKLKIIDNTGSTKLLMVQRGFEESNEQQKMHFDLSNIELPARLTDIYVGQDTPDILSTGSIYIGNVIITSKNDNSYEESIIPKDEKGPDSANVSDAGQSNDTAFKIAIYDSIEKPITLLDNLKNTKFKNTINTKADMLILTSQNDPTLTSDIAIPITCTNAYSKTSLDKLELITIDVTSGGLRATDYTQWISIMQDIKSSKNKNVIILMKGNLDNFTDTAERKLFIDTMCQIRRDTNKNIWIINETNYTDYSMERGIRYLSINNENFDSESPIEVAKNSQYILITVYDNTLTYEIRNIF